MTRPAPTLLQAYGERLRQHAHELIAQGYARMDKAAFVQQHEPAITGELVRQIRAFLESGQSVPEWVADYSIHDDPPLNTAGKVGNTRPRVDIEFEYVVRGKRPRLLFEAKRLCSGTGHSVAGYLGEDGLGCFLSGRYPLTHGEAGMLGYIQSATEEVWAAKIASRLVADPAAYGIVPPALSRQRIAQELEHTWFSRHRPQDSEDLILVHHVLLRFTPRQ
jgi:hypothetical protein